MRNSTRNTTEVADRRQHVAARYLRGEYQSTIAQAFGVDTATISRDLAAIRSLWLASAIRDFDAAKAQELAKIDEVERAAWVAWERSTQDKEIAYQEADAAGKKKKVSLRKEGQAGAPAFLQVVLSCIERRCKILGLDAPTRFTVKWEELTDEQIDRLAAGEAPEKVLAA